jgi:phosphoserine phosphatase
MIDEDDDIQQYVRPWKGLTDDEIEKLIQDFGKDIHALLDEIHAMLKARNL